MATQVPVSIPQPSLSEDVLYIIFLLNTEFCYDWELPLDTARNTSQVCRAWRHVMLNASNIWGRLMDWRSLNQYTDWWRNEVLRRSATSLLWILGEAGQKGNTLKPITLEFFEWVLMVHWERIERLDSKFGKYLPSEVVRNALKQSTPKQKVFYDPSPHIHAIQRFAIFTPTFKSLLSSPPPQLEGAYMLNMRQLRLVGKMFDNQEVCSMLLYMPRLESLYLESHKMVKSYRPPSIINLPNLQNLTLHHCMSYVNYIKPSHRCFFRLHSQDDSDYFTQRSSIVPYVPSIAKLLHIFLSTHPVESAQIHVGQGMTRVSELHTPFHIDREDTKRFSISFMHPLFAKEIVHLFLALKSPLFSNITDLWLNCCPTTVLQPAPAVIHFLYSFPSVKSLACGEREIMIFLVGILVNVGGVDLFPNLKTLVMNQFLRNHEGKILKRLLALRRDCNCPITRLDLTYMAQTDKAPNLEDLEEFVGLNVVWKRDGQLVEYICGSGQPDWLSCIHGTTQ